MWRNPSHRAAHAFAAVLDTVAGHIAHVGTAHQSRTKTGTLLRWVIPSE